MILALSSGSSKLSHRTGWVVEQFIDQPRRIGSLSLGRNAWGAAVSVTYSTTASELQKDVVRDVLYGNAMEWFVVLILFSY